MNAAAWQINATKILTRAEIAAVLADMKRPDRKRSPNTRMNLCIFRLATCCGLRASEICGLKMSHVRVGVERPYIRVPKEITKGKGKSRHVPLWWDQGTLDDITAWKNERKEQGAKQGDYFVCAQSKAAFGKILDRRNARDRFIKSCCRVLGPQRQSQLTVHHGRHSYISHALAGGRSLAEVRDAAGHSNVSITSVYTHVANDDDGVVGDLFSFDNGKGGTR